MINETNKIQHHDHKHLHLDRHNCADSGGHSHGHSHGGHDHGDLGMMGVMIHVIGDAINNLGVMAAGLVIWLVAPHPGRYYADPGVSMFISILILLSSLPLSKSIPMGHNQIKNRTNYLSSAQCRLDSVGKRTQWREHV